MYLTHEVIYNITQELVNTASYLKSLFRLEIVIESAIEK
jgi:hypothetical protein